MRLFTFVSVLSRFAAFLLRRLDCVRFSGAFVAFSLVWALLLLVLWVLVSLVVSALRAAFFVCVPRPLARPSLARGLPRGVGRWFCLRAPFLPSVRSSVLVFSVLPAVVRRSSGLVCAYWVFVVFPFSGDDSENGIKTKIEDQSKNYGNGVEKPRYRKINLKEVFFVYELKLSIKESALNKIVELYKEALSCRVFKNLTLDDFAALLLEQKIDENFKYKILREY